jgi:hypothetical protein
MRNTIRHQLTLQRIVDSPGSTEEEIAGARAELRQGEPEPTNPLPLTESGFEFNSYFEDLLAVRRCGLEYLDALGVPDDPRTHTPLYRYVLRRGDYYAARGELPGALE